jgi:hypothetical protein
VFRRLLLGTVVWVGSVSWEVQMSQSFELDSTGSTYPFVARLSGTMERRGDSLHITVAEGLVKSQIPGDVGADGVVSEVSVAFGLGRQDADGWVMDNETPPQEIVARLEPENKASVPPLRLVVVGLDSVTPRDRWLVAEVRVRQHLPGVQAGILSSYACAETNLAGATESSRKRAAAMKAAYSTTC